MDFMDIDCNAGQYSRQQLDLARLKRSLAMGRHSFSDDEMGDEYDAPTVRRSRTKQTSLFPGYFFVLAAWGSLIIPVGVVVSFLAGLAVLGQYKREHNWVFGVSFLACVGALISLALQPSKMAFRTRNRVLAGNHASS